MFTRMRSAIRFMAASIAARDAGRRFDRQIGEIDIDRQTRHVADKQIDRRAAFEGEACLLRDMRQHPDEQRGLLAVEVSGTASRSPPAR